jgi:DNA-binding GntR family transcriptional regulator
MDTALYAASLRSDFVYNELKERLLAGDFRLNVRLAETRLATTLGVSRTPVREALLRLHAEGLLVRSPDGGLSPRIPDVAGTRLLYEVRAGLEVQALLRPSVHGTHHDLGAVEALRDEWSGLAPEPAPEFVLLDESFHVALAESAGNPALADLLRQVNERIRTVRMQDFLSMDRVTETIAEHIGIADAVLAGTIDEAVGRFNAHLGRSMEVVEARVGQAVARMLTPEEGQ